MNQAATLIVLASVEIDPADVDAEEAARAVLDAQERVKAALERRGIPVGGFAHVLVLTPMDRVGATLGAFAESLEAKAHG